MARLTLALTLIIAVMMGRLIFLQELIHQQAMTEPAEPQPVNQPQVHVTSWTSVLGHEEIRTPRNVGETTEAWPVRHRGAVISAQVLDPPV